MTSSTTQSPDPSRKTADEISNDCRPASVFTCPSCKIATQPAARFCHACGASLDLQRASKQRNARVVALIGTMAAGVVTAAITLVLFVDQDKGVAPTMPPSSTTGTMPPFTTTGMGSGQPIDLSTMTPREAADRLFNRIMVASEQGNLEEALRFVPMALQAYGQLDTLDADAHYHLGRIHAVAGDTDSIHKEIATLKQLVPNHLLGIVLEHDVAEQFQDKAGATQAYAAFVAAYDAEIKAGRQEYRDHQMTIEKFRAAAGSSDVNILVSDLTDAAQQGAALFAKNCAACHGPNAAGSKIGPPLVHQIYEPDHHDDEAFYRAAQQGVQSHHWPYGDMPPTPGVSNRDIGQIIAYVRALQSANGIR